MYLWDVGLMFLIFFKNFSQLHDFLCLAESLLFSYDSFYTYFVQYVEYKNGEQSRLLIPIIQNMFFQKLSLYSDFDLR
jgi:hypothetical protein